jgi:hypothetical protein
MIFRNSLLKLKTTFPRSNPIYSDNEIKRDSFDREEEIERIKKMITDMQTPISKAMIKFKDSMLAESISVSQDMVYDENTIFNEGNITQYLAEAEEYISNLLAVVANKSNLENPIIKALPLDKMVQKNFNRAPIRVTYILILFIYVVISQKFL